MGRILTDYFVMNSLPGFIVASYPSEPMVGAKSVLAIACANKSNTMKLADLTQPTFPGYAEKPVNWDVYVYKHPSGIYCVRGTLTTPFVPSDASLPQDIIGCALLDTGGTDVLIYEDLPFTWHATGKTAFLDIEWFFGFGSQSPGYAENVYSHS